MIEETNQRRSTADRVKALEEKVDNIRRDYEYGPAVQAAFQAGEAPEEPQFVPRKGFGMLQFQRSSTGLTDDCIEALMANLTALDGLGAGDLARRLDRMEDRLEEVIRFVLSSVHSQSRSSPRGAPMPQPPQDLPPNMPAAPSGFLPTYLSDPPTALTAVMEEAASSAGSFRRRPQSAHSALGDESMTAADLDADSGAKFLEVQMQRSAAQPSWGLLWDRKCFDKRRRVIEAIVPSSPAGIWNQERMEKGQDHLQRGDELVKLNGKPGWEACSELTNQQQVQLLFRRPTEQEKASRVRRNSRQEKRSSMVPTEAPGSLTESQRMRISTEARGKSRHSISSTSSPSRGTGGCILIPQSPPTGAGSAPEQQPPLQRNTSRPVKSQDSAISDPQNTIQVLQAALAGGPGAPAQGLRGPDLVQPAAPSAQPPELVQPAPLQQTAQFAQPGQPVQPQSTQTAQPEQSPPSQPAQRTQPVQPVQPVPLEPAPVEPPPSENPQDVSPMVAAILAHSRSVRAADPGKASLINPPAEELNRLASHLLAGEAGPAMSLVLYLLQKSVRGPDGRVALVAVEQTEAAQYLLDLLTLLDSQQTSPPAK